MACLFSGLCFACLGRESCCCSRLSEASHNLLHGMRRCGILVSDPASQRGCWPQEKMFYGFQRWREAFFLACVFGLPELGLLWCLAFSDPLPTSFIFMSVQVIGCLSATILYLCFFFTASKLQVRHRVEGLRTHRFWLARARLVAAFGLFGSVASSFGTMWKGCERTVFGLPFFWLVFCMPWARILLLFEAFGSFA